MIFNVAYVKTGNISVMCMSLVKTSLSWWHVTSVVQPRGPVSRVQRRAGSNMSAVRCGESLCLCRVPCRAVRARDEITLPAPLSPLQRTLALHCQHSSHYVNSIHSNVDIRHSWPQNVHLVHCLTVELFTTKCLLSTHHDTVTSNANVWSDY